MRTVVMAGTLLGVLLLAGTPANAELTKGDAAAPLEGEAFFNTEPVTLEDLRGRVVFLELFATT